MKRGLENTLTVFQRELRSYFESPVAYVFMIVFLMLTSFLSFSVSGLYERRIADLEPFFLWHPWVYLLLVPAATMGLWAEERRSGTIELLLTMPITLIQTILGKFLAAWLFLTISIVLTFPVVLTVMWLGAPDGGVIFAGYVGSILMAGAYVSVGMLASSLTRSQIISFVISLFTCLILLMAGWPPVTDFFIKLNAPHWLVEAVSAFSFAVHFDAIKRGVMDFRHVLYFACVMVFMIASTHVVLDNRKAV